MMRNSSTYEISAPKLTFEHSLTEELQEIITLISEPRDSSAVHAWRERMKKFLISLDCDEYEMDLFNKWNFIPEKAMKKICATDNPNFGYQNRIQELVESDVLVRLLIDGDECYTFIHLPVDTYLPQYVPTMSLVIECDITELLPLLLRHMFWIQDDKYFSLTHESVSITRGPMYQLRRYPTIGDKEPVSTMVDVCGTIENDKDADEVFTALNEQLRILKWIKQDPPPAIRFLRKPGVVDRTSDVWQFLTSDDDINYDDIEGEGLLWKQFRDFFRDYVRKSEYRNSIMQRLVNT